MRRRSKFRIRTALVTFLLIVVGVLINVFLERAVRPLGLPVYMDTLGTVLVSLLGGSLPGVLVAFATTVVRGATLTWMNLYFGVISVFIAVTVAWLRNRGVFRSVWRTAIAVLLIALLSGILSTVLTWFVYGYSTGEGVTALWASRVSELWGVKNKFQSLLYACLIIDLIDKVVIMIVCIGVYYLIPARVRDVIDDPLVANNYYGASASVRHSLLHKVITVVLVGTIVLGALACGIGYYLYRETSVSKFSELCRGVTVNMSTQIDPERVDEYIEEGEDAPDYLETEAALYKIKDSFSEIEYAYCYRIETRGCRVVFDLDTEDEAGADPGDLIPFDESFSDIIPLLRAGKEIDPIITDDTYGWLLTVYTPLRDSDGNCVCYVCADIKMGNVLIDQAVFLTKMFSLFFAVAIIVMSIALELAKANVVFPINAIAKSAEHFAYDTESGRINSLEHLKELHVDTGDEIGNLYRALTQMAEDSDSYIKEVKMQSDLIAKMQEEIILDFAEMVESRDKCTGDHIKKTSHYVRVIADELKNEGKYSDLLTDEYIEKLVRSAPLHDVGKIKISDVILNKPGKLTEEEFELMKTHTTEGKEILSRTSGVALSSGYLKEAIDMAYCHHERWDGTGYPCRMKGEEIPLSARIMAVADVFDALVSQRSYKQPFSYEKAVSIIKEESGTHFDPAVVDAFLAVSEKAYFDKVGESK